MLTNAQVKHMVDRFLGWRLPENFSPDGGISFQDTFNENSATRPQKYEPSGTNLFDAAQADAMVRHMLIGVDDYPSVADQKARVAWLIEAPGPRYLGVAMPGKVGTDFLWTSDANEAVGFTSNKSADSAMEALRTRAPQMFGFEATLGNAVAREHRFVAL